MLKEQPVQTIPSALRSKSGQANKRIGQGKGYDYSHDFPENIAPPAPTGSGGDPPTPPGGGGARGQAGPLGRGGLAAQPPQPPRLGGQPGLAGGGGGKYTRRK